jgi:hypothetical protein
MSGFDGSICGALSLEDNAAPQHWTYALHAEISQSRASDAQLAFAWSRGSARQACVLRTERARTWNGLQRQDKGC